MATVRVYTDDKDRYLKDIGESVLPADVPELDFTMLDQALETENLIAEQALETMMANLEKFGAIQDELTGIKLNNAYDAARLEEVKKKVGLDDEAMITALNGIDNPAALYDVDRKLKQVYNDRTVQEIMMDSEIANQYKQQISSISDPYLRAEALKKYEEYLKDGKGDIRASDLNIQEYAPMNVAAAYKEVLDNIAPMKTKAEPKTDAEGNSYIETRTYRDPDAVARANEIFMGNKVVENNLKAQGFMKDDGTLDKDDKGNTIFDILGKSYSEENTEIKYYKSKGKDDDDATGDGKYNNFKPTLTDKYTPDLVTSEKTGAVFDLAYIRKSETNDRSKDAIVHVDPGNKAVNVGAYSFNGQGGAAKPFFAWLKNKYPAAKDQIEALEKANYGDPSKENVAKIKEQYLALDSLLGGDVLKNAESAFVIEYYADPIVQYAEAQGIGGMTKGQALVLLETAMQFGPDKAKRWIMAYSKGDKKQSLIDYITDKRAEANDGAYKDRAYTTRDIALQLDEMKSDPGSTGGGGGSESPTASFADMVEENLSVEDMNEYGPTEPAEEVVEEPVEEPTEPTATEPADIPDEYTTHLDSLENANKNIDPTEDPTGYGNWFGDDGGTEEESTAAKSTKSFQMDRAMGELHKKYDDKYTDTVIDKLTSQYLQAELAGDEDAKKALIREHGREIFTDIFNGPEMETLINTAKKGQPIADRLIDQSDAQEWIGKANAIANRKYNGLYNPSKQMMTYSETPTNPGMYYVYSMYDLDDKYGKASKYGSKDEALKAAMDKGEYLTVSGEGVAKYVSEYGWMNYTQGDSSDIAQEDSGYEDKKPTPSEVDKALTSNKDGDFREFLQKFGDVPLSGSTVTVSDKKAENEAQKQLSVVAKNSRVKADPISDLSQFAFSSDSTSRGLDAAIKKYNGYKYNFEWMTKGNGKEVDCSGFVSGVLNDVNSKKVYGVSEDIYKATKPSTKKTFKPTDNAIDQIAQLPEETIIALDTGDKKWDRGRKYGIDHIAILIKDKDGNSYLAEAADSKGGVVITPLKDRLREIKSGIVNIYTGKI